MESIKQSHQLIEALGIMVGDRIRIHHLEGEDCRYDGKVGVVEHIDGIGQLHGTWGGLAIIPGTDDFSKL